MSETRCPLPITHKVEKIDETANGPRAYVRSTVHLMAVMAINLDAVKGADLVEACRDAQEVNTRRILRRVYQDEANRAADETLKVVSSIRPWADPEAVKKLMDLPQHYRYMPPRTNQDDTDGQCVDGSRREQMAIFRTRDGLECMASIGGYHTDRPPFFPRNFVRICPVRKPCRFDDKPMSPIEYRLHRRNYEWTGRFVDHCPVFEEVEG